MSVPRVSIISAVYNVEHFLRAFIESIIAQTFSDWELLLIDDGSTDNSRTICQSFADNDGRIFYCKQEHRGVSSARNKGLQMARGEWLYFADSDDLLLPDCLQTLCDNMDDCIDLVSASYRRFVDGKPVSKKIIKEGGTIASITFFEEISQISKLNARWLERYLPTKLLRQSIVREHNLTFDEELSYREDVLFLFSYLIHCSKSVIGIDKDVYCYFRRSDGLAMTGLHNLKMDFYHSLIKCYALLLNNCKYKRVRANLRKEIVVEYDRAHRLIVQNYEAHVFRTELKGINEELRHVSIKVYLFVRIKYFLRPFYHRIKHFL